MGGVSFVAYGYFFATSNQVHVDVQYSVTLESVSVVDSSITLKATVTNNGLPVRAGLTVDFYSSVDGGAMTYFTTQYTDDLGVAQAIYAVTSNGAYDFEAIVTIP